MKKFRLVTTIFSLVLAILALSFGVYASFGESASASGKIIFTAPNIDLDFKAKVVTVANGTETIIRNSNNVLLDKWSAGNNYQSTNENISWDIGELPFNYTTANKISDVAIHIKFYIANNSDNFVHIIPTFTASSVAFSNAVHVNYCSQMILNPSSQTQCTTYEFEYVLTPNGTELQSTQGGFTIGITAEAITKAAASERYEQLSSGLDMSNGIFYGVTSSSLTVVNIPRFYISSTGYVQLSYLCHYEALINNNTVNTVIIPDTMTSIDNAFAQNSAVANVILPETLTIIRESAFQNCTNLTSIYLPHSIQTIGRLSFSGSGLTSVVMPDSLTTLNELCFQGSAVTSVKFNSSLTSIPSTAFAACSNLIMVKLPTSLQTIGERAFAGCTSLTVLDVPESITEIGQFALSGCISCSIILPSTDHTVSYYANSFSGVPTSNYTIPAGYTMLTP